MMEPELETTGPKKDDENVDMVGGSNPNVSFSVSFPVDCGKGAARV